MSASWNKDRLDIPNPFPGDGHVTFLGETLAGLPGFAQHLGKGISLEMALVEGDAAILDDTGDDPGLCRAAADGAGAAVAFGDAISLRTHFGGGEERIFAALHRRAAGMRRLAVESDRVPLDAERPEDGAEREIEIEEHGSLFDVQFQIGGGVS